MAKQDYEKMNEQELRATLMLKDALIEERGISDRRYAMKMVERIVYGMLAVIFLTVLGAILNLIVNRPPTL
ncbi:MAG TPA: hypothetical protein VIG74_00750 [Alphaproteobacteria bacterium]|jgi:cell division protein FtsL